MLEILKILNRHVVDITIPITTTAVKINIANNSGSEGNVTTSAYFLKFHRDRDRIPQARLIKGANDYFCGHVACTLCKLKGHYQTYFPVVNSSGNSARFGYEKKST